MGNAESIMAGRIIERARRPMKVGSQLHYYRIMSDISLLRLGASGFSPHLGHHGPLRDGRLRRRLGNG